MNMAVDLVATAVCVLVGLLVLGLARQTRTGLRELAAQQDGLAEDLTEKQNDLAKDLINTQHGLASSAQETFIALTNTQHELFRDLAGAQQGLQETLRNHQEIIHQLKEELRHSISNLQHLREVLDAQRLPDFTKQRILSLEAVAMRERNVSEIWILAVTIDYELAEVYLNVIAENLKQGKKYTYFFQAGRRGGPGSDVQKLVRSLERSGVSAEILRAGLRVFEIDEPNLLTNITIHDPRHGRKQGYLLPVLSAVDDGFQVRLDDELYDRIVPQMSDWIDTARLEFPTSGTPTSAGWPR